MTKEHSDKRLDALLQELGPAEPPSGFAREVMSTIEGGRARVLASILPFNRRGMSMILTKKAMWGLAAAAAVILVVFITRGFPPVGHGN